MLFDICLFYLGNDWTYDDEDGGCGSQGTILSVRDNGSVVVNRKFIGEVEPFGTL